MLKEFDFEKAYTRLKGFAAGANNEQTMLALRIARKLHAGQKRSKGEPYISHPIHMACNAIALGLGTDTIVAATLLHDCIEDCDVQDLNSIVTSFIKFSPELIAIVEALTCKKDENGKKDLDSYYGHLKMYPEAIIVKLIDRVHNVSTMAGAFSVAKMRSYIEETRQYVLPLVDYINDEYPEYENAAWILKSHINSVCNSIEICLDLHKS